MTDKADELRSLLRAHIDRASRIPYSYPTRFIEKAADELLGEATDELLDALYQFLGSDHIVIFTEDCWTVEHPLDCRLSGQMEQCAYHKAVANVMDAPPSADMLGRWKITDIDSEGCPSMERCAS